MFEQQSDESPRCPGCGLDHSPAPGSWHELEPADRPGPRPTPPQILDDLGELLRDPTYRQCVAEGLMQLLLPELVALFAELHSEAHRR